jgi:RNA polymerase sigma-70 factor, ECF subfamily
VAVNPAAVSARQGPKHMTQSKLTDDFERAIYPHLNSAYNLARWLLRSDQDAEDVVHDSFLRAHRYFDSFDGTDGRAWLLGIVRNACFSWLRTNKAQPLPPDEAVDLKTPSEASPERMLLLNEDIHALRNCIELLPPEYRAVVVLRELEELSYKEIATAAGVAIGTVMSRLNRARARLENCLKGKAKDGRP